jgi:hypothetical protein
VANTGKVKKICKGMKHAVIRLVIANLKSLIEVVYVDIYSGQQM